MDVNTKRMRLKPAYDRARKRLLEDPSARKNRELLCEFFELQEYKLKRLNGLSALDDGCYRTLLAYAARLRNVNRWFGGKAWTSLTREDIRRVYDDLEDGTIRTQRGTPVQDKKSYYTKVFKSTPFELAGKAGVAREVIRFPTRKRKEVRFATEEAVRRISATLTRPDHQLLLWLAWDIGENIQALLSLAPRHFCRQPNPHTGRPEYLINLPQEHLKRTRRARTEPTLYDETVQFADIVLAKRSTEERVFHFEYAQARKMLYRAANRVCATARPGNTRLRWKDLRSGMACHLLKSGWSRDQVNARLGHTPSSSILDAYINYLALDRAAPKRALENATIQDLRRDLTESAHRERLLAQRLQEQQTELSGLASALNTARQDITALTTELRRLLGHER